MGCWPMALCDGFIITGHQLVSGYVRSNDRTVPPTGRSSGSGCGHSVNDIVCNTFISSYLDFRLAGCSEAVITMFLKMYFGGVKAS